MVDAKGNPVTNLCVENYKSGGANPAKDYSKERWFAYTDSNGVATLCRFSDASDSFYVDNFHSFGNGDKHDFQTCEKAKDTNLKANHNLALLNQGRNNAVFNMSKIQI